MATNQIPLQRPHRLALSPGEEMSLIYGERPHRPGFASAQERKAAWFAHRDELLVHCRAGRRPAGWWDYESPARRPRDHDYEEAALFEAGLFTAGEVAELMTCWRERFKQAQRPGFAYCIGRAEPGDSFASWLDGAAARKAHYRRAGIPRALIRNGRPSIGAAARPSASSGRRRREIRRLAFGRFLEFSTMVLKAENLPNNLTGGALFRRRPEQGKPPGAGLEPGGSTSHEAKRRQHYAAFANAKSLDRGRPHAAAQAFRRRVEHRYGRQPAIADRDARRLPTCRCTRARLP